MSDTRRALRRTATAVVGVALTLTIAVSVGGCSTLTNSGKERGMNPATPTLEQAADQLRAATTKLAEPFAGERHVVTDLKADCDPQQPGRSVRWDYIVRIPAPTDAADLVTGKVVPAMRDAGWRVTDRSSDKEIAYQFSREGSFLGVNFSREGGGDVVFGGSSRCLPTSSG